MVSRPSLGHFLRSPPGYAAQDLAGSGSFTFWESVILLSFTSILSSPPEAAQNIPGASGSSQDLVMEEEPGKAPEVSTSTLSSQVQRSSQEILSIPASQGPGLGKGVENPLKFPINK